MKKRIITGIVAIVIMVVGVLTFRAIANSLIFYEPEDEIITEAMAEEAFMLLNSTLENGRYSYFEYMKAHDLQYGDASYDGEPALNNEGYIAYEEKGLFQVTVEEAGYYHIQLIYDMEATALNNATIKVEINSETPFFEASTIDLPLKWQDERKEFSLDSYGDESLPMQIRNTEPLVASLYNNTYDTVDPLLFYLEAGENSIAIENVSSSNFKILNLSVDQPRELVTYETYRATHSGQLMKNSMTINAIHYSSKNSSYLRMMSYDSPTVSPYDPVDKKLNIIAGDSWMMPGKEISYEVNVATSGFYKLALHYYPGKDDYMVFRSLRIDGEIPFEEVKAYALPDTKGNDYIYETLSDENGDAYEFYLEAGVHEITFRAEFEPVAEEVRTAQLIIDHINQFALDIRKITGREVDQNRTWQITKYIPETGEYLQAYDTLIKYIITKTSDYAPNGAASSTLSFMQKALVKMDRMLEKPDELPLYFEDLYSGSGSVNQMLGDSIELLSDQPLSLNELTFYGEDLMKRDNAPMSEKIASGFEGFIASFTSDKYVVKNEEGVLNVWVNRPITHVDTLQKLVDSEFTKETGIKVKISVMPDANKLVLASAAGEAPDVAMGLLSFMPFDLAIRNAAYDLTTFEDFWTVADRFAPGAFVPYILDDNVYALPETLEFFATVYRKDIFDSLGFQVPETWEDVTELLPELQRYGMNFYHQIAGGGSLKWFYQTSPFIYQEGGTLYSPDGLKTAIDSEASVKGLEFLTDLFTMYSLPEQEPLFYNAFRYGTLPIGIADFTTYMQIKNAAPELVGNWELAPYPGTENAAGDIERWFIANGRGSVILEDTKRPDEAWEFLKWWTDTKVQTTYGYTLQSIYGPEYLWLSGNLDAVANSAIDMADKLVILDQINWLRDVPRTPGQYMLERGISDIWNKTVYDGVPTRIAIDRQVITINREIERKMIEFGYLDENGEILKPYIIRGIDWIVEQIRTNGGEADEE